MDKRSLLAVFLSSIVIFIYYTFFVQIPETKNTVNSSSNTVAESTSLNKAIENTPSASPKLSLQVSTDLPPEYKNEVSELSSDLVHATFQSLGGDFKSLSLNKYRVSTDPTSENVNLLSDKIKSVDVKFEAANFSIPATIPFELKESNPNQIIYEWKNSEYLVRKIISFPENNYVFHVKIELENLSGQVLQAAPAISLETLQTPVHHDKFSFLKGPTNLKFPVLYKDASVTRYPDLKNVASEKTEIGAYKWLGVEDRYFLWAIISRVDSSSNQVSYGIKDNLLFSKLVYPNEVIASGSKLEKEFTLYLGPKEVDLLKSLNVGLEAAVDYGWFAVIAKPILYLLKLFHSWVGNWGLAIILLTVFIKILLHPINKKSLQSMKGLQKIQPLLKEIQQKYANDKERLNQEMMNLFKTHKVNPMGGCLPMVLQMPVYIALYKVLYNAIELYHSPFFAYYKDLSAPDPYFVSPILLGIFMVLQQKLTPNTTQDPSQAKMMMIMPVVFSLFMLFLPSGLVIYIFVNTAYSVVQQYLHQHDLSLMDLLQKFKKAS